MKKLLVSAVLALSLVPAAAMAFDIDLPGQITKLDATYRCEKKGGGVSFRVPREGVPAKVWHSDAGDEMGLEFEVERFDVARCPGCYRFVAKIGDERFPREMLRVQGLTRMVNGRVVLDYKAVTPEGLKPLGRFNCVAQTR